MNNKLIEISETAVLYECAERELLRKYVDEFALIFDENGVPVADNWEDQKEILWRFFKEDVVEIFSDGFEAERIEELLNRFPKGTTLIEIVSLAFPKQEFVQWLAEHQPNPFEGLE